MSDSSSQCDYQVGNTNRFMWMSSPQEALDVIAEMIHMEEPLHSQDEWLKAAIALGYVQVGVDE